MPLLFSVDDKYNDFLPFINSEVEENDLKNITKKLCRSYKNGMIPEHIFHEVIEQLLAFYIERSFSDKILAKKHNFETKLYKFNALSKW